MSVDQTISELSQTLAQLGNLVGHINGQINGITSRLNLTLDNFDTAVSNLAKDAGSVTNQVGHTVAQVPNSWVFYILFITLIVVFILLSVLLLLNLVSKGHAIMTILKSKDGFEGYPLAPREDSSQFDKSTAAITTPYSQQSSLYQPHHRGQSVSINMENEPRRPGIRRGANDTVSEHPSMEEVPAPRPYQRHDGARYNVESGTASSFPRSLDV